MIVQAGWSGVTVASISGCSEPEGVRGSQRAPGVLLLVASEVEARPHLRFPQSQRLVETAIGGPGLLSEASLRCAYS